LTAARLHGRECGARFGPPLRPSTHCCRRQQWVDYGPSRYLSNGIAVWQRQPVARWDLRRSADEFAQAIVAPRVAAIPESELVAMLRTIRTDEALLLTRKVVH